MVTVITHLELNTFTDQLDSVEHHVVPHCIPAVLEYLEYCVYVPLGLGTVLVCGYHHVARTLSLEVRVSSFEEHE